jgi:alkylation response protein AidB-like acyl-CoA dehydrogenase
MSYNAPIKDMLFNMQHLARIDQIASMPGFEDAGLETAQAVLEECARFNQDVVAPLNWESDKHPSHWKDGHVTTAPGFKQAYKQYSEGGWQGLQHPVDCGGQGLPKTIGAACVEMLNAASLSFALCPLLTDGAIEALLTAGSDDLKATYLDKLVSGEWTRTMNLTEPQAGSDLSMVRSRAEPQADGTYKVFGTKIYITYGEHDLTENIIHLVLARLPDAPAGTRGISLFLVPKFLVNPDGSIGARNDVRCAGIEKKLGIHASPTCTMVYGDGEGAIGYLIGEENRGLACMFTMMNSARLGVGLEGVAIAERATQLAFSYAKERKQGRSLNSSTDSMSPIIAHPDVQRMLLTMRAETDVSRALCFLTAAAIDRSRLEETLEKRQVAAEYAALLTPVAKAYSTDMGIEVASLGIQVHGGMGFIESTGAAQHLRDARIASIYEGTNGIQAIDLVTRKLPLSGGRAVSRHITFLREILKNAPPDQNAGSLLVRAGEAIDSLEIATDWINKNSKDRTDEVLASADRYLKLFALATGAAALIKSAFAENSPKTRQQKIAIARFYAEQRAVDAPSLCRAVIEGASAVKFAAAVFED